jgi:class 3 adenylate cyclase/tetratricopeptide (TPR) repeat protein
MTASPCDRCGQLLPEGARFCPNCGYPVGAPPPEERKVVTVIFVDLVGSTKLSARIDPERYRRVLAGYYRLVAGELESLGGRAYNLAGDAVVGVFGIPHAHDDDSLRAVRAGLSLVDRIGGLGEELGLPAPLRVRVGIHSGPVAIGSEASEQGLLFGATVNLAARLQQASDPGTVSVSETSYLLTRSHVEYGPMRKVEAEGFEEEARSWPVVGLRPESTRRTIALVDRRRELRLLQDTFEGVLETGRGHLVTLFGEPGIGKSRVAEEFVAGLPAEAKVLVGRASAFEEDVTFAPIAQILLHEVGERPDAPPERLLPRLEDLVLECCPKEQAEQVVARLGLALGLGEERRDTKLPYRVAEVRSGMLALLEGLSAGGPVVLVIEDLQAVQPSMLDLIEQVVREARHIPLLVLCVARYSLLDERPDWGGGLGDSLNLYLEALSLDDAIDLASRAGEGLDDAAAERIARHAGGNPFFIVETTGMLRHTGEGLSADTGPLPMGLLPPTVQAVVAARIDHLGPQARDLVRKASVFPRSTFSVEELALIADPADELLAELEDEELVERDEDREGVWRFRHGLVRDVAYESLPKRERRRLHTLVADGLEQDPESSRYPRSIAYHLERAALAALDLDPGDRGLADRAVRALAHAGDVALASSDMQTAEDAYRRALDLAGPQRAWGPREAPILASLGEAKYWLGEFERAIPVLERALELGSGDPLVRAHAARFLGDIHLSVRGDRERAVELFDAALAAAREVGDPWALARTLLSAGWAPYWAEDMSSARAMFEEALQIARTNPEGDPWAEVRALTSIVVAATPETNERERERMAREALVIAERSGDPFSVAVAKTTLAGTLRRLWRLEAAAPLLDDAVRIFGGLGSRWELADALIGRGVLRRRRGEFEAAVVDLREALRICRELKERSLLTWASGELARTLLEIGDLAGARQVLEDVGIERGGDHVDEDLGEAWVRLLLAEGGTDEARRVDAELLKTARRRGWPNQLAAQVWRSGQQFGPDAVGGPEELERARATLVASSWEFALREAVPRSAGAPR